MKFTEITTKDCPTGITPPEKRSGRAFQFYLRPKFYSYLRPEDRKPENWEELMAKDDILFAQEEEQRILELHTKAQTMKDMISETASTRSHTSDNADPDMMDVTTTGAGDDDDEEEDMAEAEDPEEPPAKRSKLGE
jgi:hypothetical protein